MSDFSLSQVATLGLPVGQYVIQITDIEGGTSGTNNPKIQFKGKVAQSANPDVKVGHTAIWSYTWQKEWLSILTNDLLRAGLPKNFQGNDNERIMAQRLAAVMVNQFYTIQVKEQKNDPTRTNTSFVGPFNASGAGQQPAQATAPVPVMQQPIPVGAPIATTPAPVQQPAVATTSLENQGANLQAVLQQQMGQQMLGAAYTPPPAAAVSQQHGMPAAAIGGAFANAGTQPPFVSTTPTVAPPPTAAAPEPGLDTALLTRIIGGERPGLNATQLGGLRQVLPAIAAEYDAAMQMSATAAPAPAPAPAAAQPVPAAAASAFQAV